MKYIMLAVICVTGCSSLAKIQKQCKEDPYALGYYNEVECIKGEREARDARWQGAAQGMSDGFSKSKTTRCTSYQYGNRVETRCD